MFFLFKYKISIIIILINFPIKEKKHCTLQGTIDGSG
jgi:hypothetical protein